MPEINGQLCECLEQDPSSGRWLVKLQDGSRKKLKPENLTIFSQDDSQPETGCPWRLVIVRAVLRGTHDAQSPLSQLCVFYLSQLV